MRQLSKTRRPLRLAVAGLMLADAAIHAWVAPEHFEHWWAFGMFFLVLAVMQFAYGASVLLSANPLLVLAGISINLVLCAIYLESRTVGIPIGPHAGYVEAVTLIDLASKGIEVAAIILLVALWRLRPRAKPAPETAK